MKETTWVRRKVSGQVAVAVAGVVAVVGIFTKSGVYVGLEGDFVLWLLWLDFALEGYGGWTRLGGGSLATSSWRKVLAAGAGVVGLR